MERYQIIKEIRIILENNFMYEIKNVWLSDIFKVCDKERKTIDTNIIYLNCEKYMNSI